MVYTNWRIEVGGFSKGTVIKMLQEHSIELNAYAKKLFEDERFVTSDEKYCVETVEMTVADLGFSEGATLLQIFERAGERGLGLCPLELAPYFRLQYVDQPEDMDGGLLSRNKAPTGSITVASPILSEEEGFPKGFYLRNIAGALWLRGYNADEQHVWSPSDCFLFRQMNSQKNCTEVNELGFTIN